ncbi:MAG: hypothetical protein FJW23_03470 [Acidimicrobiia bacterium]|nr:hypothetical protein [Acidimicrobiia bacterium]
MRRLMTVMLGCAALSTGCSAGTSAHDMDGGEAAAPAHREVSIPPGTVLALELQSTVSSEHSRLEDPVRATLRAPLMLEGVEVLPAGSVFTGHVTAAERAGRVKGRARIAFRLTEVEIDNVSHNVAAEPVARRAEATKGDDARTIGIGAGAGAALGAIFGGGSGAARGAAIGGAAGTGAVLATRGADVELVAGSYVTTRLTAPLTLGVPRR